MSARLLRRSDRGHSMVEVIVTVGLLVLVSSIVYGLIIQTQKITRTSNTSAFTQTQLLDAVSRVTRDVATAKRVAVADKRTLAVESTTTGTNCVFTEYAVADGDADGAADDLVSRTKTDASCVTGRTTLAAVPGVSTKAVIRNIKGAPSTSLVIFRYFDATNVELPAPVSTLGAINRVSVDVAADVTGRQNAVRLTSSASPRSGLGVDGTPKAAVPVPAVPTDVDAAVECATGVNTVTWTRVLGSTGYLVFRNGTQVADITDGSTTTFTYSGVANGATETIAVRSKGVAGTSAAASTTATRCPAAPVLSGTVIVADGDADRNDNELSWTAVTGATTCTVYRVTTAVATLPAATRTWVDRNRPWGSSTPYQVACTNAGGTGAKSNTVTLLVVPAAPVLSGTHADGDRTLTWTAPASSTGYELQRRYPSATAWATVFAGAALTSDDTAAIISPTFDYQVRASNATGAGNWSNIVVLSPNPAAPVLSGVANDGNNALTWPAAANATGYRVLKNGAVVATLGNVLTWTDAAPGWASTHNYVVVATNKTGDSPNSNTVTLRQKPGPFTITGGGAQQWAKYRDEASIVTHNQPAGIYADWSPSANASSYDVSFDGALWGNDATADRFPAGTGYHTTNVVPGNSYTVGVIANAANGTSRAAVVKEILVPPTPPKTMWGATYCNQTYNANGWKYGMLWNGNPMVGTASSTEQTTRRFHQTNPGQTPPIYSYDNWIGTLSFTMTNTTRETLWGGTVNTSVIANGAGEGGGMFLTNYKTGTYNFGRNDSMRFGMNGHKFGSSPVACPAGQTTWDYNQQVAASNTWTAFP